MPIARKIFSMGKSKWSTKRKIKEEKFIDYYIGTKIGED
jgi:hypothetical protein